MRSGYGLAPSIGAAGRLDTAEPGAHRHMLSRLTERARLLLVTVGPLAVFALTLVAGRRW